MTAMHRVYLDTEFSDLDEPNLLSIGMMSEDGSEFYGELELDTDDARDRMRVTSDFVQEVVLPQWGRIPGAACSHQEMGRRAGAWLLELASRHGCIEVLSDCRLDFELLEGALRHAGLHPLMGHIIKSEVIANVVDSPRGQHALAVSFERIKSSRGLLRHHALADAESLFLAHFEYRAQESLDESRRTGSGRPFAEVMGELKTHMQPRIDAMRAALQSPHRRWHRIISLDFDGVTHESPKHVSIATVAPLAWLDHLERLLEPYPDVGLLVHSSWRETYSVDEVLDMLHPMEHRFVDVVPPGGSGPAIAAWRFANSPGRPMLVIDDAPELEAPPGVALVRCDPRHGLADESAQRAIAAWLDATRPVERQ